MALMDFVMLNLSFEFHTILWYFDKQKLFVFVFLCLMMHARSLHLPLAKSALEFKFSGGTQCAGARRKCI